MKLAITTKSGAGHRHSTRHVDQYLDHRTVQTPRGAASILGFLAADDMDGRYLETSIMTGIDQAGSLAAEEGTKAVLVTGSVERGRINSLPIISNTAEKKNTSRLFISTFMESAGLIHRG